MKLQFFKNSSKRETYYLAVNIRNENIISTVVKSSDSAKPVIVLTNKFFFNAGDLDSETNYFHRLLRALEMSLKDIFEKLKSLEFIKIEDVFFSFSSLFSFSRIGYRKWEDNIGGFFSDDFSNEAFRELENDFKDDLKKQKNVEFEIINRFITQVKLNGYKTLAPYGKKARRVEVSTFASALPLFFLKRIEEKILKFFNIHNINIYFEDFTLYKTIDNFWRQDDFVQISVNNLVTRITLVKDGQILKNEPIFFGVNDISGLISEEISKKDRNHFNLESDKRTIEILSLFGIHKKGDMDEKFAKIFESAAKKASKIWAEEVKKSIFAENGYCPKTLFVFADERLDLFLKSALISAFSKTKDDKTTFRVIPVNSGNLSHFCEFGEKIIYEAMILSLILFSDKIIKEKMRSVSNSFTK